MKVLARLVLVMAVLGAGFASAQQGTAAGTAAAPEVTIVATPAMWRVKGAHGTVYLFGSVHVMKPNVVWESAKVKAALDGSDLLYLEIANIDDTASVQPIVMQFGIDSAHPLSTKISKEDVALLDTAAKAMGLPGEQSFEPMQPWLVSVTLSTAADGKGGVQPGERDRHEAAGRGEGRAEAGEGFRDDGGTDAHGGRRSQDEQVRMLHKDLAELDKSAEETNEMVAAWEKGDVEKIGKIDNDELAVKYPDEYKRIVVDRNTKWAATMDGLLKDPATGTVFVAVGAAHLAGPDSC